MAFDFLESERLILRRFTDADLATFLAYRNDPEIARYQSWESMSRQEAENFIQHQQVIEPGEPGHWFQFAAELKETGTLIGDCALKLDKSDDRQGEFGFTISRPFQGKGYATEATSRVLDYAFLEIPHLHRLVAITDCRNLASVSVLERLGLRREGHFLQNIWFKGEWGDEYQYAVLKQEWIQQREGKKGRRGEGE